LTRVARVLLEIDYGRRDLFNAIVADKEQAANPADSDGISDDVRQLILYHVDSVDTLEVLLHMYRNPSRTWTAEEVATALYISPETAEERLSRLTASRLLVCRNGAPPAYCFDRRNNEETVAELEKTYEERRVRVINLIFSKPLDFVRSFADAFRFRKK
jgi:hypothetical protein